MKKQWTRPQLGVIGSLSELTNAKCDWFGKTCGGQDGVLTAMAWASYIQ